MLNKLTEILDQEITLYKELLSLIQEEKMLLSNRLTDELYDLANRIETLALKTKSSEGLRNRVVGELSKSYGLTDPLQINLSGIINVVEGPYKGRLKDLQSKLLTLVEGIKGVNKENGIIVNKSIENIKTAHLFLKEASSFETYQSSGRMG